MYGAVIHGQGDVRFEERPRPEVLEPTDAVVRTVAAMDDRRAIKVLLQP